MDTIESKFKKIKSDWKFLKKHLKGFSGGFLLCLSIIVIIIFILFRFDIVSFNKLSQANISQTFTLETAKSVSEVPKITCEEGMFLEKSDNWKMTSYNQPDEDGFYCPRSTKKFLYSNMWYKKPIPTDFDSVELRYKLKNKDNGTTTPPSFILSVSQWDGPDILHFYVPEKNWQIVGFEKIVKKDNGFSMEREEVQLLDEPIEYGTEAELKARIRIIEKNKARFDFNLKYISALNGKAIENGFSYEVNLPVPSPESELSKLQIGFGTLRKNCINPISYRFCY